MIHQTHRFHGRKSLNFVFKRGQTIRTHHIALKYVRNPQAKSYRVAVVVSRKVSKLAVVRNRIRRRIYEVIRTTEAHIVAPYDMVFIVYEIELAQLPAIEVRGAVQNLLHKAGIVSAHALPDVKRDIVESKEKNL